MPGMMDTILNLGLNDQTVGGLAARFGDRRFAYDSYRRFIQMYSNVVLDVRRRTLEDILDHYKHQNGHDLDTDLTAEDWQALIVQYKDAVQRKLGRPSRKTSTSSFGAQWEPCSRAGTPPGPSSIAS